MIRILVQPSSYSGGTVATLYIECMRICIDDVLYAWVMW